MEQMFLSDQKTVLTFAYGHNGKTELDLPCHPDIARKPDKTQDIGTRATQNDSWEKGLFSE